MQIVCDADNLHELSNHVFWEKQEKTIINVSSAEYA